MSAGADETPASLPLESVRVDLVTGTVRGAARDPIRLTPIELKLLRYLSENPGTTLSRDRLYRDVWSYRDGVVSRALDLTVARLRAKVERDPVSPDHVLTVYGVGYRFRPAASVVASGPADRFVGRTAELASLTAMLAGGGRLMTLVGPPGIGKTELARRLVGRPLESGGASLIVRWCDLTEARSPLDVAGAVSRALGVPLPDTSSAEEHAASLAVSIHSFGPLLVVLDDAERVVEPCRALLERWLPAAPEARFLSTSRERFGLPGEILLDLGPLGEEDAAALFADRARLQDEDRGPIRAIVRRLDGIPLAIELCAAQYHQFPPDLFLEHLARQLSVPRDPGRPARHSTLFDAIGWSWDLLAPSDREALARCAVFRGGFDLAAADAVLGRPADAVLAVLRDKSLVGTQRVGSPHRFVLLESVRAFAASQRPELAADARDRHARHFGALAEQRLEAGQVRSLEADTENLIDAGERACAIGDSAAAVRVLGALEALVDRSAPRGEVARLIRAAAQIPTWSDSDRCRIDVMLLWCGIWQGALPKALAEDTLARARAIGDRRHAGMVLELLARHNGQLGATALARAQAEEAQACFESIGADRRALGSLRALGSILLQGGELDEAESVLTRGLERVREKRDLAAYEVQYLYSLGTVHQLRGRIDQARECFDRVLALASEVDQFALSITSLAHLGAIESLRGRPAEGAEMLRRAITSRRRLGLRSGDAWFLNHLGSCEMAAGQRVEAGQSFAAAYAAARETHQPRFELMACERLAALALESADVDEARRWLDRAAAIRSTVSDPLVEAVLDADLGETLTLDGHAAAGRTLLERAVGALQKQDQHALAVALCQFARTQIQLGDRTAAAATLERATAIAGRIGAQPGSFLFGQLLRSTSN